MLATLLHFLLGKADMPEIGDKSVKELTVPTDTVLALMQKQGSGFSYQDLDAAVKQSDMIKNMIKSMDPTSIVIKASASDPNDAIKVGDETDVASMASRASKKRV
jgi:hypothetical protein